jgi:hypothetical protein
MLITALSVSPDRDVIVTMKIENRATAHILPLT